MLSKFRNWVSGSLLAILLAVFGWNLYAIDASLSGTVPTTYVGGGTIPAGDLVVARIYRNKDGGAFSAITTISLGATQTTVSFTDPNLADGVYCYKWDVVRQNGTPSDMSAVGPTSCKTVDTKKPSTPAPLTVN